MNYLSPISVLVAAERAELRRYLRSSLDCCPNCCVLGEASAGPAAVSLIRRSRPRVVLVDLELADRDDLTAMLLEATSVKAIAIVREVQATSVIDAIRFGAHGILCETAFPGELQECIRKVVVGNYFFGPDAMAIVVETLRHSIARSNEPKLADEYALTRRELQIIAKITAGCSNRRVGEDFAISERTVKHHLTNIYSKVSVSNRLALALFAVNHQLMSKR